MNLPQAFERKMKSLLKEDYTQYIACFNEIRHYGLRVNTNKLSVKEFEEICPFEITPIPWIENGFYYDGDAIQPGKHPFYFAGLYYLQEPSAMTPANRLPIYPGDKVLDICAAPGGKATELGAKLNGKGILYANDISVTRAKALLKNLELFGIKNAMVLSENPEKLECMFQGYFDKILIDAPCSGEGMFRKDKKMMESWENKGPAFYSEIQKEIIIQAAHMLKKGGLMLYSTCTFDPLENEQVIEHLLQTCPEFEIIDIDTYEGFQPGRTDETTTKHIDFNKTVRIWPHKMKGEGHYLALLQKSKSDNTSCIIEKRANMQKEKNLPEDLKLFFENISWEMEWSQLLQRDEKLYYLPVATTDHKKIRFLRTGLYLGDLKGDSKRQRFEPSQSLAMALKKQEYRRVINFSIMDERVIRYLKGETLEVEDLVAAKDKGWYLVCVECYPLGWCKVANGTLKNKYYAGWRWQS